MKVVSIVKEKRMGEKRVILMPEHVKQLVNNGYNVLVEHGAGVNVGLNFTHGSIYSGRQSCSCRGWRDKTSNA